MYFAACNKELTKVKCVLQYALDSDSSSEERTRRRSAQNAAHMTSDMQACTLRKMLCDKQKPAQWSEKL